MQAETKVACLRCLYMDNGKGQNRSKIQIKIEKEISKTMQGKFKDSKFMQKLRNFRISRTALVTIVTVIIVATAIIAITVAANRANKNKDPNGTISSGSESSDTKKPLASEKPSDTKPSADVSDKLPTFALPVSGTLSSKHDPELQVYSPTMNDYRVHLGIDINTTEGAPVYAAADGKVEKIWEDTLMGYCIAISHAGDAVTVYKNMSKTYAEGIEAGAKVKEGQLIGSVGDSAMVEVAGEPHLHFEMTVAGVQVDPLMHFSENAVASLATDDSYEK